MPKTMRALASVRFRAERVDLTDEPPRVLTARSIREKRTAPQPHQGERSRSQ